MNQKKGEAARCLTLFCVSIGLLLAGCAPAATIPSPAVFVPATPVSAAPTITPSLQVVFDSGQPSPTTTCTDNLVFRSDVTIPDGTSIQPDATLDKRWEVENSGSCNWQENYRIRLIAGPDLGAQPEQALYPARSGSSAVIRIVFKAPAESGTYRSAWQAFNPQGEPFGDPFFIEIVVE